MPARRESHGPAAVARRAPSIRCARGWKRNWRPSTAAAAATRPRTTRSAATRMPRPSSRASSIASRRRPSAWAATVPGFFSLFNGQSAQCGPVNNQIQQMRGQPRPDHQQPRAAARRRRRRRPRQSAPLGADWRWRRTIAARNTPPPLRSGPGNFFDNLFGNNGQRQSGLPGRRFRSAIRHLPHRLRPHLRRLLFPDLVRHRARPFRRRREDLQSLCPAAEATLFTYRNPGEDINQAVSISGQTYSSLPNAFHYRQEFNPSCSCKAAGQTWADALKTIDDKAAAEQQGDIIVTEESAKKMSRAGRHGRSRRPRPRRATPRRHRRPATPRRHLTPRRRTTRPTAGPTFIRR